MVVKIAGISGVPAVVQWVKNLTAVSCVTAEAGVQSHSLVQWVKGSGIAMSCDVGTDSAQIQHCWQLQL